MNTLDDYSFCKPYLTAGECVLWRGKPQPGHLLTAQDVFMIPFSILWCGFAIFWESSVIISGAPFFFSLWGFPFVCAGLYFVFGRFFWTAYLRKHTAYVITNKKILRLRRNKVDMLDGKNLPMIHVTVHKDGSGTISFELPTRNSWNSFSFGNQQTSVFALENVPDIARVQQYISAMEH